MDVIEFYEFSSKDFGKIVYLNFYKSTIEAVPSAKVPSNRFHYDTIGWNMNYKGTQVSLTYSNLILKFDKFIKPFDLTVHTSNTSLLSNEWIHKSKVVPNSC